MTTQVRAMAVRWGEVRKGILEGDLGCGAENSRLALGSLDFTDRMGRLRRGEDGADGGQLDSRLMEETSQ